MSAIRPQLISAFALFAMTAPSWSTEYQYQMETSDQRDAVSLRVSSESKDQSGVALKLQIGGEAIALPSEVLGGFPHIQAESFRLMNQQSHSALGNSEQLVSLTFNYLAPEGARSGAIYFRNRRYFMAIQSD